MTDLQPLLVRGRYTGEEWELASNGQCAWNWSLPHGQGLACCEWRAIPDSVYRFCAEHDQAIRQDYGEDYGR